MKYKEFKEKIRSWGQKHDYETEVEINFNYVIVKTKSGIVFRTMAIIRTDLTGALDTDWEFFRSIKVDARVELLSIIVEFAKTPPEDRKDEKRFIIPLPELTTSDGKQQYLTHKDCKFFASRRDKDLRQTWKEEYLELIPEQYRQFAEERQYDYLYDMYIDEFEDYDEGEEY